ncbi:hypothetical protein SY83_12110 [Paenibacillus swuensis]|uniref:Uncharacterized protein n=1 Tax=Paenibacillus swuensis TaxID=1178515 RepID=A0A172TJ72_9BACL|nr:hypothetical protein [Paenibacillus swuensis]ANE46897.1 hypothetical protein SY83_12110 [Paenibacillus swuensis]
MRWKIIEHQDRYLVCRKTWHSMEWMGIEKKDIRILTVGKREITFEVYAECQSKELAHKLLFLKQAQP